MTLCEHSNYHCPICEVTLLKQVIAEQDKEIERLRKVEEDYNALQSIMDRARRMAFLSAEDEEPGPRFKMDANGNLTRIED
nr:hypothetical protein [Paenibacillus rigui]